MSALSRRMGKNGSIAAILLLILVSDTCSASLVPNFRRLITSEPSNHSTNSQISPIGSPVSSKPIIAGEPEKEKKKESQLSDQNNNNNDNDNIDKVTLPIDSKGAGRKNETDNEKSGALKPPSGEKNGNKVDQGNSQAVNATTPQLGKNETDTENSGTAKPPSGEKNDSKVDQGNSQTVNATSPQLDNNDSCEGSLPSCRDGNMITCIKAMNDGSKELFLVVLNGGESDLHINVNLPDSSENALPVFEVPKHGFKRVNISATVRKSTAVIVNSGNAKCVLPLAQPVSVDYFMRQVSFYSRQVTPIYSAYAFFLLALLFGGTWACCKLRKKSRQEGIPYQELEMGLPESASAVNVDSGEGWDHDWDDDDWDEDNAVKSPGGHQIRSISVDGLTSRSSRKEDGWEKDWED